MCGGGGGGGHWGDTGGTALGRCEVCANFVLFMCVNVVQCFYFCVLCINFIIDHFVCVCVCVFSTVQVSVLPSLQK